MYLGKIMEQGPVGRLFAPPFHPYTEALLSAVPVADPTAGRSASGSRATRRARSTCRRAAASRPAARASIGPICDDVPPPLRDAGDGHTILCHIPLVALNELEPIAIPEKVLM